MKCWYSKTQIAFTCATGHGKTFKRSDPDHIMKMLDYIVDNGDAVYFNGMPIEVYEYAVKHKHRILSYMHFTFCSFA